MVEEFRLWATKLGCPQECMPSEESLKSIFKSPQRELFLNMMQRVRPRQEVKTVRENILINKMARMKDLIPVHGCNFLPREVQTYLKVQELEKRKAELEAKLEEQRREHDTLATSIKRNNLVVIQLEHKNTLLDSKVTLLRFKTNALDADLKRESAYMDRIKATMPVKLSSKNASEKEAGHAVERALELLNLYYDAFANSNGNMTKDQTDELWNKMRDIFSNVPAFLIFNVIMRNKDDQLQNIISMKKPNSAADLHSQTLSSVLTVAGSTAKEPLNNFEMKLLKTKSDLLTLAAKLLAARDENRMLEERFASAYAPFVCEVQKKVQLLNNATDTETEERANEIISNFLVEYSAVNFEKAENDYLAQQIEQYKHDFELNRRQLEKHEILLGSIKELYMNINTSIKRIHYEMLQLGQIKDKIVYSKNLLKLMLDDVQSASTAANSRVQQLLQSTAQGNKLTAMNCSMLSAVGVSGGGAGGSGGVDSFELVGNDVFCSTKLDFDCTIASFRNTTLRGGGGAGLSFMADTTLSFNNGSVGGGGGASILPQHLAELNAFAKAPLSCFSCVTPQCAIYLAPNPFIIDTHELLSTMQLAPGILLTAHGALREVIMRSAAADLMAAYSGDFKLSLLDLVNVDPLALKQRMKRQREHATEILDKIDVSHVHTKHTLRKLEHLYQFLHDNQLRHYVPKAKCFNNLCYTDYEAEYMLYYRMATVGASFK